MLAYDYNKIYSSTFLVLDIFFRIRVSITLPCINDFTCVSRANLTYFPRAHGNKTRVWYWEPGRLCPDSFAYPFGLDGYDSRDDVL